MTKHPKPKKYIASLAPTSEYRRSLSTSPHRGYRHISYESNSLEAVLRWLQKIEERKYKKRFPWHSAYIYRRGVTSYKLDNIFSFSFKY